MIIVLDAGQAEVDLAAGVLGCPRCGGRLRPWSRAAARPVRRLDGSSWRVRPRRARCQACRSTQLLLPAGCLPRRGDTAEVVGAALLAKASGVRVQAHRTIAAELGRPPTTVRRWLRAVRGPHTDWLRAQGIDQAHRLDPAVLADLPAQPSALGDALTALGAAVRARRPRLHSRTPAWTLITMLTRGRLLARRRQADRHGPFPGPVCPEPGVTVPTNSASPCTRRRHRADGTRQIATHTSSSPVTPSSSS